MQFDHTKESNENLFFKFRYLQSYVCQHILQAPTNNAQTELLQQKKYAACLFSHVSGKAKQCFSEVNVQSPTMSSKEEEQRIDACFHDLHDEVQQVGQRLQQNPPDLTKYIVRCNHVAASSDQYPQFFQQVLEAPKQHCAQENALLDACLKRNPTQPEACYRERVLQDLCFSVASCAQPLKACLGGQTNSTALVECLSNDQQTGECLGEATRLDMVYKAQSKYADVAKKCTFDGIGAQPKQMNAQLESQCGVELNAIEKCNKEGTKVCYQERMNLAFCSLSSICGKYLAQCMQSKNGTFDSCMDDKKVHECLQHMQKE